MTVKEAYFYFNLLLNKNNEQKDINIEPYTFIKLYNRESERWLSYYIELNNSSDNITFVKDLIQRNKKLDLIQENKDELIYKYPENYFSIIQGDFYSEAVKGSCVKVLYNNLKKPQDVNSALYDKFTQPSFMWERGLSKLTEEGIVLYKKDFNIKNTYLSYYKKIDKIDIEGYTDLDGKKSKNIHPNTSDFITNKIIDRVVLEVQRQFENSGGFQLSQTREQPV